MNEKDFFFPSEITIPPAPPEEVMDQLPPVISIDDPEVSLTIPYFEAADTIVIMKPGNPTPVATRNVGDARIIKNEGRFYSPRPAPAEAGKMNILIMASGYGVEDIDAFRSQAENIKRTLLGIEPFATRSSNINIHIYANTNNLGCETGCLGIDRLLCCDSSEVISAAAASGFLYDEIIVIHNTPIYAGSGYREEMDAYKTNSYSTYAAVYDGYYSAPMAIHEFGHSFGNLCDEYLYDIEGYTYSPCVNCMPSRIQYPADTVCQLGCDVKPDYYRPDNSIMESLSYPYFNDASISADYFPDGLKKRLNFFIQAAPCTYDVSPSSCSFTSSGGTGSVSVTASSPSCTWTTFESLSWVSLSSTGGTGTGAVTITVNANTGSARSGSVTIAGQTHTISQQAGVLTKTTAVLTKTSPNLTINAGTDARVYGTASSNQIILVSGAKAELMNFPGQNAIQIQANSNIFTVSRSGGTVTFQGSDGTVLKIPATTTSQSIVFNDVTRYLIIDSNRVMLGNQEIGRTSATINITD